MWHHRDSAPTSIYATQDVKEKTLDRVLVFFRLKGEKSHGKV